MKSTYTVDFSEIRMGDVARVGGKNASLGELFSALKPKGVGVLDGFALTTDAYWRLLEEQGLRAKLEKIFSDLDPENLEQLAIKGHDARTQILQTPLPEVLRSAIRDSYGALLKRIGCEAEMAVRSSASAEDLPEASFAGAAETFLNVRGEDALLRAVHQCFASLFTDRAISYRTRQGFPQLKVALSVGVMPMVRSGFGFFRRDFYARYRVRLPGRGHDHRLLRFGRICRPGCRHARRMDRIQAHVAQRIRFHCQPAVGFQGSPARLRHRHAFHAQRGDPAQDRARYCLTDSEVLQLARWACLIEQHYSEIAKHPQPMDIEWAKDGLTGELFIVQARPETVHSAKKLQATAQVYRLKAKPGRPLVVGQAVGEKIGAGRARVVTDVSKLQEVQPGEVLIAQNTDPDWEPVMRRVAAIVTDQGGRTAHAAIVSREFGIPCIVGTGNATRVVDTGRDVTVCCSEGNEGHVYDGRVAFEVEQVEASKIPDTRTKVMLILGDPGQAFHLAAIPNAGVGLARIEFIVTNHIGIHPMALAHFPNLKDLKAVNEIRTRIAGENPHEFFIRRLSEGVARIAAAFYPKPVIVRMSDFKTNEYARLLGGEEFEPREENPMIGFRGASRYYDPRYSAGFALECLALARVRNKMGLTNLKVMIPFCRTVDEGKKVIAQMAQNGLRQGDNGLEVYAMCEIPANVILADEFLKIFDGYSIGSNDLTQLTLGLDRDSGTVAHLFDENNAAVRRMIASAIRSAQEAKKPIGICGQAPSDFPEFAEWLVTQGIDSISLNPDTAIKTALRVAAAEQRSGALVRAEAG